MKLLITRRGDFYCVVEPDDPGSYERGFLDGVEAMGCDGEFEFSRERDLPVLEHNLSVVVKNGTSTARGAYHYTLLTRRIELIKEHLCNPTGCQQEEGPATIRPSTCSEKEPG